MPDTDNTTAGDGVAMADEDKPDMVPAAVGAALEGHSPTAQARILAAAAILLGVQPSVLATLRRP